MINNTYKGTRVSVVIPCLNRADYLVPTIESVLQQNYPNIECIVVDGGSTDNTVEILKRYEGRIQWISEPDNGHADAINKGWKKSRGEILAWLNADDVWALPDAVSRVVQYCSAHPDVDVLYGDCGAIDEKGILVGMSSLHEWNLEHAVENCDYCIPQPAAFIKRRILEKVGWLDTDFHQKKDHELWLRIGLEGKIEYISETLASARRIAGLSQDGKTVAPSCVQVTKKFYSLKNIPDVLIKKKRRALSNSYLKGMDYAFAGGREWSIIYHYAIRSIFTDPSNIMRSLQRFLAIVRKTLLGRKRYRPILLVLETPSIVKKAFHFLKQGINILMPLEPNLAGRRAIEWSWITAQIPGCAGEALNFGTGESYLALMAARKGFHVTAIDMQAINRPYIHPSLRFIQGDLLKLPLPKNHFDLVINCSSVEHTGMAGRYGVPENRPEGDLEAMARLKELMKPEGVMLLTIPVGQDAVFAPLCRVYGIQRLPRLLDGFLVEKEEFWIKNDLNQWILCGKDTASSFKASMGSWDTRRNICALGCFVLKRP